MKGFLLGAAAGYVLGAKAGRQRYEQIVSTYRTIVDHPQVRSAAHAVREKVGDIVRRGHIRRSVDDWRRQGHQDRVMEHR
jgi:hypothetical protein